MKLIFRTSHATDALPPAPGEVHLRPLRSEHQDRRDLACLVLEHGLDALPRGEGPVEHLVLGGNPTLDELLAATFAERLLSGQPVPAGGLAFARYAGLARQGLRPSNLPLHVSLEGIYLAIRNAVSKPDERLIEPAAIARFQEDWSRMASCILKAAEAGVDPFTTSLFETGPEFARERAFLAADQRVYQHDLRNGERWLVRIPREAPPAAGLLLRKPRSLLFKHWSREDAGAPGGHGYLFLAVQWDQGHWVFSTDPVHNLSLQGLAEYLQRKEAACDPERAAEHPWFDGRPFNHTLVAAPRVGTVLAERRVLRAVRRWTDARPLDQKRWRMAAAGAAALALVAGLLWWLLLPPPQPPSQPPSTPAPAPPPPFRLSVWVNDQPLPDEALEQTKDKGTYRAVVHATLSAQEDNEVLFRIPRKWSTPVKLRVRLQPEGALADAATVTVQGKDTHKLGEIHAFLEARENNDMVVRIPSQAAQRVTLEMSWEPDPEFKRTLHVLALGVSEYADRSVPALKYACRDAEELVEAFRNKEGFFGKVNLLGKHALTNEQANRDNLLDGLKKLRLRAHSEDLAIITLSGHGFANEDGHFFFFTHEFKHGSLPEADGVSWELLQRELEHVECPVIVVIDACYSGAIKLRRKAPTAADLRAGIAGAVKELPRSKTKNGIVILAACGPTERGWENDRAGHGVLTLAVLEAITGERLDESRHRTPLPQESGVRIVTLEDLRRYAEERVDELVGREIEQNVVVQSTEEMDLHEIRIAAGGAKATPQEK
jgi:hypothetical protein